MDEKNEQHTELITPETRDYERFFMENKDARPILGEIVYKRLYLEEKAKNEKEDEK